MKVQGLVFVANIARITLGLALASLGAAGCGGSNSDGNSSNPANVTDRGHRAYLESKNHFSESSSPTDVETVEYDLADSGYGSWLETTWNVSISCPNSNSFSTRAEIVAGSNRYNLDGTAPAEYETPAGSYAQVTFSNVKDCSIDFDFALAFMPAANPAPSPTPVPSSSPSPTPSPSPSPEPDWIANAYVPANPTDQPELFSCLQMLIQNSESTLPTLGVGHFKAFTQVSWEESEGEEALSHLVVSFQTDQKPSGDYTTYGMRFSLKGDDGIYKTTLWDDVSRKDAQGNVQFKGFVGKDVNPIAEVGVETIGDLPFQTTGTLSLEPCRSSFAHPLSGSSDAQHIGNVTIGDLDLPASLDPAHDLPSCLKQLIEQGSAAQKTEPAFTITGFGNSQTDTVNSQGAGILIFPADYAGESNFHWLVLSGDMYEYGLGVFAPTALRTAEVRKYIQASPSTYGDLEFTVDLSACANLLSKPLF